MKVGSRVETPHGGGEVIGYEFKGESHQRYIVKLDNPENWAFSAQGCIPHYFQRDIKKEGR